MHASSCAFTVVECIRTSKNCTFFTCPSFFCWSRRKGLHILFAFCIFSMIQYSREKSSMNYPLSSTEDYSNQCCDSTYALFPWNACITQSHFESYLIFGFSEEGTIWERKETTFFSFFIGGGWEWKGEWGGSTFKVGGKLWQRQQSHVISCKQLRKYWRNA